LVSFSLPRSAGVAMAASAPEPPRPSRFRETVLASRLVETDQLEAAEAEARIAGRDPETAPADWDGAVADSLVARGLLTKFQARELLAGRTRFRLGHYTVLDEIGRGGMGQVFRAEHAMMGREVALKVLPRAKSTPEYEAAFQREIRVLARLDHENLVRALDAGHDAKVYYLVTELVAGLDLRRQVLKYGPLDELAAASVIAQAAHGLAYAHEQGLVHRDVKPGNLLVAQDGRVKVLDLGLAGSLLDAESTTTGRVVGTMDYMAPEQIRSPDTVGPAADVYGLGCTLYFALTGQVPFPGGTRKEKAQRQLTEMPPPLSQLVPHVDAELRRIVEDMMRKSSAERIGTAAEVIQRLRPWTPRTPVPMPRTAVAASDRRAVGSARPLPPPLPHGGPSSPGGGDSSAADASSSRGGPPPGDEGWPSAVESSGAVHPWPGRSVATDTEVAAESPWEWPHIPTAAAALGRQARGMAPAAGVAALVGVGFGGVMALVRTLDAARFDAALGFASPPVLGCIAGLAVFLLQAFAGRPGR
jgi:serine/threonine protein kinase